MRTSCQLTRPKPWVLNSTSPSVESPGSIVITHGVPGGFIMIRHQHCEFQPCSMHQSSPNLPYQTMPEETPHSLPRSSLPPKAQQSEMNRPERPNGHTAFRPMLLDLLRPGCLQCLVSLAFPRAKFYEADLRSHTR